MRLELTMLGETQFSRELLRMGERADDMLPAFEDIADMFFKIEREQFATEGTFSGGWEALAPSTVAFKAAMGYDPRILHRTLRMRRSLTGRTRDTIREVRADSLKVGTRVEYAIYHQHGTGRMPRRRPIEFTEKHRRDMVKILQRYLIENR